MGGRPTGVGRQLPSSISSALPVPGAYWLPFAIPCSMLLASAAKDEMAQQIPASARIYIANFGKENYLWPECLRRPSIATIDDEDLRDFWLSGNREGYIDHCIRTKKTVRGRTPTRALAGRWHNVHTTLSETAEDVWIHREKDDLWWTISTSQQVVIEITPPYKAAPGSPNFVVLHKPASPWSNKDLSGRRLSWKTLHPKAQTFLFTEGTLQRVSEGYAEYARALLEGRDLSDWHSEREWRDLQERRPAARGTVLNPIEAAAAVMAAQARETALRSNGQEVLTRVKNKDFGFDSDEAMREYLIDLLHDQEGMCAISALKLQFPGEVQDSELQCSLDRVDSNGHYAPGNLQIVCRFINRWKSSGDDTEFRRLVRLLRSSVDFEGLDR